MTIPGRRPEGLRTPTSDPVSPNIPWHPELDRYGNTSFGVSIWNTKFDRFLPLSEMFHWVL